MIFSRVRPSRRPNGISREANSSQGQNRPGLMCMTVKMSGTCCRPNQPDRVDTARNSVPRAAGGGAGRREGGVVIQPAAYRTRTQQRMVQDREEIWFRAPCPDTMDMEFVATLQRALKARGLYLLPLSGLIDAPTRDAIRRFQAERGLDSPRLSLGAARELGLSTVPLDQL